MKPRTVIAGRVEKMVYRFRVEWPDDVEMLRALIPEGELVRFESIEFGPFRDMICEVEMKTLPLPAMRELCRKVPDGHVMLQTMQPKERFTGERDFTLR